MAETPPVVLTIAGFDPCSGAGVTADIKTIAAHGCYGVACITAMTVQSTAGVRRVEAVDPGLISDTLNELAADIPIAAVHIGMLGTAKVVRSVVEFLSEVQGKSRLPNIVLDPILKSSSGADLLDATGTKLLIEKLIPLATVLTPNVDEAAVLTGMKVTNPDEMRTAAAKLHEMGSAAVVITGGHLDKAIDLLSFTTKSGIQQEIFKAERQRSNSTHGTGCAFRDCTRLPPCSRSWRGRSYSAGQNLCNGRHRGRSSVGTRHWSGPPSLPHEPAAPGSYFRERIVSIRLGSSERETRPLFGRLLQQNSGNKRGGRGQQPFNPPHLNRLKLRQIRSLIEEADAEDSDHAAQTHDEGDQCSGG